MEITFNTLLVFPTSRSIRQYINNQKNTNQFLYKTITIGDLFSNTVINTNKILINKDLRILYLKQAISNIDIKKLGLSSSFSKFYNQSEYIFKFFNELNSEFKTIEDINIADTFAFYSEHIEILNSIYYEYYSILDKNNLIDRVILPTEYKINIEYIKSYDKIIIDYEGYFSSFEFYIIKEISKYSKVYINMYLNEFNTKNIDMFKTINLDLKIDNIYKLDISKQIILKEIRYKNQLINHKVYPIKQRITQIAFIKYTVGSMIKSGLDATNIVVILPDEKFKTYLQLFDEENYFNFAMGNDIKLSITYNLANAISNYIISNELKDKKRLEFLDIKKEFIDTNIIKNWNKKLQKEIFFKIIDFIIKDEHNEQLIEKLIEVKLSLQNILFANEIDDILKNELTLKDGYKIFLNKLNEISLDDIRSGKITVMGILETRGISFDGVILIDFNDDKVPKRSIKDKFMSSNVKQFASLPTLKHREDLQKYYYKRLFDSAKQVAISYVNDDSNTISRFSTQLFTKINIINSNFSSILKLKNNISLYDKDIIMDINLSLLTWSATSLKTYLQCKRKYYYNYILKIKEHDIVLKPKAYEIGFIIHSILEKIYKDNNITYENLCNEINQYQTINPYLTLELEIWKKKLRKFISNEYKRFKNNFRVYSLEKKFNLKYKNISVKGTIDRVDKLNDNTYAILDYKTSNSLKIDSLKTIQNSNDFQLEFYYLALRDMNISQVAYYDLNDASIKEEIILNEKLERLDSIFKSLNTKKVNFIKCEDYKACAFCTYKIICGTV
jgi:RecB family exonuclease